MPQLSRFTGARAPRHEPQLRSLSNTLGLADLSKGRFFTHASEEKSPIRRTYTPPSAAPEITRLGQCTERAVCGGHARGRKLSSSWCTAHHAWKYARRTIFSVPRFTRAGRSEYSKLYDQRARVTLISLALELGMANFKLRFALDLYMHTCMR